MLWNYVAVVKVAVAVGEVVCHSVWPREVEGDARTGSLVVGMCEGFLASRGFLRHPRGGVEGDVDHVMCAVFAKVPDPVVSIGYLDVVISVVLSCDKGAFGVGSR